jgi:hypothetical protein
MRLTLGKHQVEEKGTPKKGNEGKGERDKVTERVEKEEELGGGVGERGREREKERKGLERERESGDGVTSDHNIKPE